MKKNKALVGYILAITLILQTFYSTASAISNISAKTRAGFAYTPSLKLLWDLEISIIQPTCTNPTGNIAIIPSLPSNTNTYSINGIDYYKTPEWSLLTPGTYTVTVKNSLGVIIETAQATINPVPTAATKPIIDPAGPIALCYGTRVLLSSNSGESFQWYKDGVAIPGETGENYLAFKAGSYTVQIKLGACSAESDPVVITILPGSTIALSSSPGTDIQSGCVGNSIIPINYTFTNVDDAVVTGLPLGVSGSYVSGVLTISGIPQEVGVFNYTVTSVGSCNPVKATGVLRVKAGTTLLLTSIAGTDAQSICLTTTLNPITYQTNATSVTVTGLPQGVTSDFQNGKITVIGTPTAEGQYTFKVTANGNCQSPTLTGTITVGLPATIVLSSAPETLNQSICISNSVFPITFKINGATGAVANGLPTGLTGTYDAGIFTISGIPSQNGTFNYTVTAQGICNSPNISGTITVTPIATLELSSASGTDDQSICANTAINPITYQTTDATSVIVTGLPQGVTSSYQNGTLTIMGNPTTEGQYTYKVTANGNCQSPTLTGTITVGLPATIALSSANSTNFQQGCQGVQITDITYTITNATGVNITGLPAGVVAEYLAGNLTIKGIPSDFGVFNYTINTIAGCKSATATGVFRISEGTNITLSSSVGSDAQLICLNSPIQNITYDVKNASDATVSGLPNGVMGNYLNGVMTLSGIPLSSGTFTYLVSAKGSCANPIVMGIITVSELQKVTLSSDLGQQIEKGETVTLTATGGTEFLWSPVPEIISGQGTSSIKVRPDHSITYNVKISNAAGCSQILAIDLTVNPVVKIVPGNVLTPDGNGKNDKWTIKNIEFFPQNTVSIFDRSGRKIYSKNRYLNDWDGTYNGKPLNEDAYIYVIDLGEGMGLVRGTISIIRNHK